MGTITCGIFPLVAAGGIGVSVGGGGVGVAHPADKSTTSAKANTNGHSFLLSIVLFLSLRRLSKLHLCPTTTGRSGGDYRKSLNQLRPSTW
jgi:hypothetical protein